MYFKRPEQIYKKVKPLMDALEAAQEAKAAAIADLAKVPGEGSIALVMQAMSHQA